jgi:hypothetical protein
LKQSSITRTRACGHFRSDIRLKEAGFASDDRQNVSVIHFTPGA